MKLTRLFTTYKYKGFKNYLNSQKMYEIIRTILYFGISVSLFIAGYVATNSKVNLLTIVAVLGCLPACKSMVGMIMFLKFHSLPEADGAEIEQHTGDMQVLYDMVFTTYDKTYQLPHMTLRGNTVIGYTTQTKFDESACIKHLTDTLALDGIKNITFKVFTDLSKYTARLDQLQSLENSESTNEAVKKTLLSVAL